jgi:hypothetical protein
LLNLNYPLIWKEQVILVVGAASSRDHFISRLEAAPTGVFNGNLDFSDKHLLSYKRVLISKDNRFCQAELRF